MTTLELLQTKIYFNGGFNIIQFVNKEFNLQINNNLCIDYIEDYGKMDLRLYRNFERMHEKTHLEDKL